MRKECAVYKETLEMEEQKNGTGRGGAKRKMRLHTNRKALSPIFATLILIAIAVIAGIIVYMFTSGTLAAMMGGGTSGQEKVAIQSATGSVSTTTMTVNLQAQSTGGPKPALAGLNIIVKDASGNTIGTGAVPTLAAGAWDNGKLVPLSTSLTVTSGLSGTFTATLVTPAGGSFVSPSFVVP